MDGRINHSCNIQLWINERRITKDGSVRLYLRITVERHTPRDLKLRFYWPHKNFDKVKKEITPRSKNDPDYVATCAAIQSEISKYWAVVKKFLLEDRYFCPDDIVREVWFSKISERFTDYITLRSRERVKAKEIKMHTRDNHVSTANSIGHYKTGAVRTCDIGKKWMEQYLSYLMQSMTYSAAWTHLKNVRTYINDAKRRGVAVHPTFKEFKLAKPDSDPVWLEKHELESLMALYHLDTTSTVHKEYIKAFLFACFTGLRISDLKRFDMSWIVGNEIVFEPAKKRISDRKPHIVKIPIIDVAKQFLVKLAKGSKMIDRSDVKFNKNLKTIAVMAKINKNITTHVARHTFGTLLALQNTPIAVISNLLGHKTIKSTMVYIHIAEQARMNEMMRLQSAFSNFSIHPKVSLGHGYGTTIIN